MVDIICTIGAFKKSVWNIIPLLVPQENVAFVGVMNGIINAHYFENKCMPVYLSVFLTKYKQSLIDECALLDASLIGFGLLTTKMTSGTHKILFYDYISFEHYLTTPYHKSSKIYPGIKEERRISKFSCSTIFRIF